MLVPRAREHEYSLYFGQESLHQCEIMIKDIDDSRRINSNLRSSALNALRKSEQQVQHAVSSDAQLSDDDFCVSATMISHVYWPPLNKESFKVYPGPIKEQLDQYSKEYAKLKNPRT